MLSSWRRCSSRAHPAARPGALAHPNPQGCRAAPSKGTNWAAKRLIDAFETMIQPDEPVLDMQRLSEADPKGNADNRISSWRPRSPSDELA